MRASDPGGRFSIPYEVESIRAGIDQDLQRPVGQFLDWYRYDDDNTVVDDIYDVGASSGGRRWAVTALAVPAVSVVIYQGQVLQNDRGYYNADILRATINAADVERYLPGLWESPDAYYLDRIVYRNEVFTPTRLYPRGAVAKGYTVLTFDASQVNPEELENDPQFQSFAS